MKYNIRGSKLEVTDAIKSYIEKRLKKLDKYFEDSTKYTANIVVKTYGTHQVVEVTIPTDKVILRAEENSDDLYTSIDLVSEKLERQIRKNKTRMGKRKNREIIDLFVDFEVEDEEEETGKITKRKTVDAKPMTEEEAILQMNLVGHDFYVFSNIDTSLPSVIYKRKDGDYGIIEMKK